MPQEVTIRDYLNNARKVRDAIPKTIVDALMKEEHRIVAMNQQQLYDGKTILDTDIHPLYTEDTFFKTPKQAYGYIKWKQKITPNSNRNPNSPNLFINGYYHESLGLVQEGQMVYIRSKTGGTLGAEITNKYANILGLYKVHQEKVDFEIVYPALGVLYAKYL